MFKIHSLLKLPRSKRQGLRHALKSQIIKPVLICARFTCNGINLWVSVWFSSDNVAGFIICPWTHYIIVSHIWCVKKFTALWRTTLIVSINTCTCFILILTRVALFSSSTTPGIKRTVFSCILSNITCFRVLCRYLIYPLTSHGCARTCW